MREANMNAVRVWGGGVYESEQFYQLADKTGILLWQDAMFACALYPINPEFLASVKEEYIEQVSSYLQQSRHHNPFNTSG